MATSLTGPDVVESASEAAPVPRPPQPIKAMLMVSLAAACTWGKAIPPERRRR